MTKSSTALMSLIAAIPGGVLAFLLVMAFLSHADKMGGTLNGVVGAGLLCAVAVALMPVGILIFGGPKGPAKPKKPKAPKEKKGKDKPVEDEAAGDSGVGLDDGDEDRSDDLADDVSDDYADSDEFESEESSATMDAYDDDSVSTDEASDEWESSDSESSDEFEFDDALSDEEFEFDFDDEDENK